MGIFVALDGGGTTTRCWVADDVQVLGRATAGSVKLMNVDEATATARLQSVVQAAAAQGGVDLRDVTRTCFGLAGSSSETVKRWAREALGSVVRGDVMVCGDIEIAFEAAFRGGPGLLVVAGTGSNLMGRCGDGSMTGVGGWGPVLGDEGSGSWIGLEAIKAALRAQDRGVRTCLLEEIESHWRLPDDSELVAYANQATRPDFAGLTTVVARCASGGDALAMGVLERAGQELADQVRHLASKMHQAGCRSEDAWRLAYTGSVLAKIPPVRRAMVEALQASAVPIEVFPDAVEPLEGALWLARGGSR